MKSLSKKLHLTTLLVIILGLSVSCKTKETLVRCSSSDFCVFQDMPLLGQGASKLPPVIAELEGNNSIVRDTGWCSAVATAMAVSGEKLEALDSIKHDSVVETVKDLGKFSNINDRSEAYGKVIHHVGNKIYTDWEDGGTSIWTKQSGMKSLYNSITLSDSSEQKKEFFYSDTENKGITSSTIINIVKNNKPAMVVDFFNYKKDSQGIYRLNEGHSLTVNGYDDGHIKIYDPWGRVYNVDIQDNNYKGLSSFPEVKLIGDDWGYMKEVTDDGQKVALRYYTYLYSKKTYDE